VACGGFSSLPQGIPAVGIQGRLVIGKLIAFYPQYEEVSYYEFSVALHPSWSGSGCYVPQSNSLVALMGLYTGENFVVRENTPLHVTSGVWLYNNSSYANITAQLKVSFLLPQYGIILPLTRKLVYALIDVIY
jgi:hypothetical protein